MSRVATTQERSKKTVIACLAPEAAQVLLGGSFNDWKPEATPMKRRPNGEWEASLDLLPGRHEYKFVVDGKWCCEPGQPDEGCTCAREGCVPNECGTLNKVLDVR